MCWRRGVRYVEGALPLHHKERVETNGGLWEREVSIHSIVFAKQVPDTKNITGEAMRDNGTVNRSALPAVFNPDDLCALEMALSVRDRYNGTVTVITMGPPRAVEILQDALCRGADRVVSLTDRRFAAADTLATSYTLAKAVEKLGMPDLIFCGRQAIDGDTAQVGPQLAEKLNMSQATYAQEVWFEGDKLRVRRQIEGGYEILELPTPALVTVTGGLTARPPSAKRLLKFRRAKTSASIKSEITKSNPDLTSEELQSRYREAARPYEKKGLLVPVWGMDDLDVETDRIGLPGSPTRVKKVWSVSLLGGESKQVPTTEEGISSLMKELAEDHILG